MWKKHFIQYIAALVLAALAIVVVVAIISFIYVLARPESFIFTLSNLLFLAGGLVLTIGAFIEFFMRKLSHVVARGLFVPIGMVHDRVSLPAMGRTDPGNDGEDDTSGGWMLIYIGTLVIALSFIAALIGMK